MQVIYTYIPETNYVAREYSFAAILLLLFIVLISLVPVLNLLYVYISTFRSMCAVPNMAVFCSSLTSRFPGLLLTYFLNEFEMFISLFHQLYAQTLFHNKFYFMPVHVSGTCAHHQEVKIALHSL